MKIGAVDPAYVPRLGCGGAVDEIATRRARDAQARR
jgi:hypothetical protein